MIVDDSDKKQKEILEDATDAYKRLTAPQSTPAGKINFGFKAAAAKKSGKINTSVITVLKDMINKDAQASFGHINYTDMDENQN